MHIYAGLAFWGAECMRIYAGLGHWGIESMRIYIGFLAPRGETCVKYGVLAHPCRQTFVKCAFLLLAWWQVTLCRQLPPPAAPCRPLPKST